MIRDRLARLASVWNTFAVSNVLLDGIEATEKSRCIPDVALIPFFCTSAITYFTALSSFCVGAAPAAAAGCAAAACPSPAAAG